MTACGGVSRTCRLRRASSSTNALSVRVPSAVCLIELLAKLISTMKSQFRSLRTTAGTSGDTHTSTYAGAPTHDC
eukprot:6178970-Pleurochrysis_carterae.AAC.1